MSERLSQREKDVMNRLVIRTQIQKQRWAKKESGYDERRLAVYLHDLEEDTQAELQRIEEM